MPNNNRNQKRYYFSKFTAESITIGANLGFVANFLNLHTHIETILGVDGSRPLIKRIVFHIRMYADDHFMSRFLAVQTAGTVSDNDNATPALTAVMIAANCDDVFSFIPLGPMRMSRRIPSTVASDNRASEFTIVLPQHLIQLLNKEVETERLQDLKLVAVGRSTNGTVITIEYGIEVEFIEVRRNITIR
jgi:hypothetical protein